MDQPIRLTSTDTLIGIITAVLGFLATPRVIRAVSRWLEKTSEHRRSPELAQLHAQGIERMAEYWQKEIAGLRSELSDARAQIEKWRAHSEDCERRCMEIETKMAVLEQQRKSDQEEIAELRTQNEHLKARVRELEQELNHRARGRSEHPKL